MANRFMPAERLARAHELGIIVDPQDEWLLSAMTWRISTKGYIESVAYDGDWRKTVKLHHYIMGTPIYDTLFVDHDDRNKLNNSRSNLRWLGTYASAQNVDRIIVAANIRITYAGKYEVRIQRCGIMHHIGTFNSEREAIYARDDWFRGQSADNQLPIGDRRGQTSPNV